MAWLFFFPSRFIQIEFTFRTVNPFRCAVLWISTHVQFCVAIRIRDSSITPLRNSFSAPSWSHLFPTQASGDSWSVLHHCRFVGFFWECHVNGIISYVSFWDWLLLLSPIAVRFLQVLFVSVLFPVCYRVIVWAYHNFLAHPIEGHFIEGLFFSCQKKKWEGSWPGRRPVGYLLQET